MAHFCPSCGQTVRTIDERQKRWLLVAETIDSFRLFPRLFLFIATLLYCWLFAESWQWYTSSVILRAEDMDVGTLAAITAFPVTLLTGLGGIIGSIFKTYMLNGRNWNTLPTSTGPVCPDQ